MIQKNIYLIILITVFASNLKAQDKGFGAGLVLGDPSGISSKYWVGEDYALQLGVKWSWGGSLYDSKGMMINADYVWHFTKFDFSQSKFPVYAGFGAQMRFNNEGDKNWFGIRVPVGITYQFESAPVDIFFEVTPIFEFSSAKDYFIDAGIGAIYYF